MIIMKKLGIIIGMLALLVACCPKQESIEALAERVAAVSIEQCLQMEERLTDQTMPRSIKDGEFWASSLDWWCSGFYPGTCWYTYMLTGDERMKELLKRYGATELPPREKRWETMEPPKDVGSVFDRL